MADELQETIDAEKRLIADLLHESTEGRIAKIESDQLNALLAHQEGNNGARLSESGGSTSP